jgi:hypothetical protein
MLQAVPPDRRKAIEALLITAWNESGEEADEVLREFVAQPWPQPRRKEAPPNAFEIVHDDVDETYRCAHEAACLRLALGTRADAELAAGHAQNSSLHYHLELRRRLKHGGHKDLAEKVKQSWPSMSGFGALLGDLQFDRATEEYLALVATFAPRATLSQLQRRRMDELVDCFATAELNWINPKLVLEDPEMVAGWIRATAHLSAFDLAVLSAQAELLRSELIAGIEDHGFPYRKSAPRDPVDWAQVADVEQTRAALLAVLGRLGHHSDHQLTLALISAPNAHLAAPRLREVLASSRFGDTLRFAWMLLVCTEKTEAEDLATEWLKSDDRMLRAAAARWWSYRAVQTRQLLPQFDRCLFDRDENVRQAALSFLEADDLVEFRERLVDLAAGATGEWQCRNCGTSNDGGFSCRHCSVGRPDVAGRLRELLGEEPRRSQLRFRRRRSPRRMSRLPEI